jgi:hypothetical protein
VLDLDTLGVSDVRWDPYTPDAVAVRAPMGLAASCVADQDLWLTKTPLVFDIFVEVHCPDRVMRQFGWAQPFPVPRALDRGVSRQEHRYSTGPFHVLSTCIRVTRLIIFESSTGTREPASRPPPSRYAGWRRG